MAAIRFKDVAVAAALPLALMSNEFPWGTFSFA